jgi:hypothetical protein
MGAKALTRDLVPDSRALGVTAHPTIDRHRAFIESFAFANETASLIRLPALLQRAT